MTRRRPRSLPTLALLACLVAAACSPEQPSSPTNASASTTEEAPRAELLVGCVSIEAAECRFVAEQVLAVVPAGRNGPFAVQIILFGCAGDVACPRSLGGRDGRAVVEFPNGGEPLVYQLEGPPAVPAIAPVATVWTDPIQPGSVGVDGQGPFDFEVGHCGIMHVVDFDRSFWIPVGQVDGDAPAVLNAEVGTIRLVGPNIAEYRGAGGFMVPLARFPGAKRFQLCD